MGRRRPAWTDGFPFTGKIHGVTFEFEGPGAELSLEERHEQALRME